MKLFGPIHTPESVAAELIRGLEDGSLTLSTPIHNANQDDVARIVATISEALAELPQPTAQAILRELSRKILGTPSEREHGART